MNAMLSALADVCRREVFREKILVVPSQSQGLQLLEALSSAGVSWLNVRPATPLDLAQQAAASDLIREGRELLSAGQTMALVEEALAEMAVDGELAIFAPLQEVGDLARLLNGTVQELRMAGLTALSLDPRAFVSPQKGGVLKKLLIRYEASLRRRCLADQALVFRLAMQAACRGQTSFRSSLFIIPAEQEFPPLVHSFLSRLSAGTRLVLPVEPVRGLRVPGVCSFPAGLEAREESPFSYAYEPPAGQPCAGVEIFSAYGAANELREVFRRLQEGGIPLDNAVLIHTSAETYIPLVHALTSRLGLPVTFAEGLPVRFTRPGRLALQLLRWLGEDYASACLGRTLISGDMNVPSPEKLARVLRRYRVGWGRDRYLLTGCQRSDVGSQNLSFDLSQQASDEETVRLGNVIEKLFAVLPPADPDGLIHYPSLASGLSAALAAFSHTSTEDDRQALETITAGLTEAAGEFKGNLSIRQALTRLYRCLGGLTTGASGPRPGAIHVASYHNFWFTGRAHAFLVGLNAETFPGGNLQDPVLLDDERRRICRRLQLREHVPSKNTLSMVRLLASHRGRITMSFPCYDAADGRSASPSGLLLQAWRLASGSPGADYSTMLEHLHSCATYMPDDPADSLTADEWWLAAALRGRHTVNFDCVSACYPGLGRGLAAAEARSRPCLTPYDGLVSVDPATLDPRQNQALLLSASQLERLATCPFSYFLSHVLRLLPPDELIYDPGLWLDNLSRGSLLHDIYCRYLRGAYPPDGPAVPDKSRLLSLADKMIDHKRREIPPPSELVFEYERGELLRDLEIFFRLEEECTSVPAFCEVPFGADDGGIAAAGLGQSAAVALALPDGSTVRLRGRIDRIDRGTGDGCWEVWDFKTGSAYSYSERGVLRQGRQIQHALYGMAAEILLRGCGVDHAAKVRSAGYIFPTQKGEGQRICWPADSRKEALSVLCKLLNLAAAGIFCASHDEERCNYCDYKTVCRPPAMGQKVRENLNKPELAIWRELQDYD